MKTDKKRILVHILSILLAISLFGLALYFDAYNTAPSRFQVRYETLDSVFIPSQMDDVTILYFSDLDYGTFMDRKRMEKLTGTINELSPDIILFGGDLFDQNARISEQERTDVTELLSSMHAPLGKFAVLGDFDYRTPELPETVRSVLFDSDFELLINTSVILRNNGSDSITLTGLDSGLYGHPDINAAFANIGRAGYNIVLSHTPDLAEDMPSDLADYVLSGHSHGGQAYWGFGALYTPPQAEMFFRGKHDIKGLFTLDITNGVGTTEQDVRFLANAEVVLYRLKHHNMEAVGS
ncbi:MAG: metallophosphoesterase [Solobacterium sp.]|nr:metallophosphoesterase [Solobacterium sp.]